MTDRPKTRFIFITGGVVSSLGKGIAAASIGRLLVARGLSVGPQKFEPDQLFTNYPPSLSAEREQFTGTPSPFAPYPLLAGVAERSGERIHQKVVHVFHLNADGQVTDWWNFWEDQEALDDLLA